MSLVPRSDYQAQVDDLRTERVPTFPADDPYAGGTVVTVGKDPLAADASVAAALWLLSAVMRGFIMRLAFNIPGNTPEDAEALGRFLLDHRMLSHLLIGGHPCYPTVESADPEFEGTNPEDFTEFARAEFLTPLFRGPYFVNLEELVFFYLHIPPACLNMLLGGTLPRLQSLKFFNTNLSNETLALLANLPILDRLDVLVIDVHQDDSIFDINVVPVLQSPRVRNLNELALCGLRLEVDWLSDLVNNPDFEGLETLRLDRSELGGDELVPCLARADFTLRSLRTLSISGIPLSTDELRDLLRIPLLDQLETLLLSPAFFEGEMGEIIASSPHREKIREGPCNPLFFL